MNQGAGRGWNREAPLALGKALLASQSGTMTASELARATGRDGSNVKRLADTLVDEGLLRRRRPPRGGGRPGRRPTAAFSLAVGEPAALEASIREGVPIGGLKQGQQLVLIETGTAGGDLLGILAEADTLGRASWATQCDGRREELMIAFAGSDAVDASLDLMAILAAAGVSATRATVGKVESGVDLVRGVRRRRDLAERQRARDAAVAPERT